MAAMGWARSKALWMVTGMMVTWALGAWAEPRVIREPDKTIYRKKTVVDFSDVAVEGELTKPEGSYVLDRNKTAFPTRVKTRSNFSPELQKSVDNL